LLSAPRSRGHRSTRQAQIHAGEERRASARPSGRTRNHDPRRQGVAI